MDSHNVPTTDAFVPNMAVVVHAEIEYTPLTTVSQVGNTNEIQEHGTIQTILNELRSLRHKFEKSDEANKKIISTLTEEVIALKTEIKQIRNIPAEEDKSLLPPLPFIQLKDFEDFEAKLLLEDDMRSQLKNVIRRVGGVDLASYLRMAIKSVISDEMAINLTWRGTADKPSIQRFTTFTLIKSACHSKFSNATDVHINKICQQHILHARQRQGPKTAISSKNE